jgi:hypothetical protein
MFTGLVEAILISEEIATSPGAGVSKWRLTTLDLQVWGNHKLNTVVAMGRM